MVPLEEPARPSVPHPCHSGAVRNDADVQRRRAHVFRQLGEDPNGIGRTGFGMSPSRIWICIAAITLVTAVGTGHRIETAVKPVNLQEVFR
jgi:hypothetical protein